MNCGFAARQLGTSKDALALEGRRLELERARCHGTTRPADASGSERQASLRIEDSVLIQGGDLRFDVF